MESRPKELANQAKHSLEQGDCRGVCNRFALTPLEAILWVWVPKALGRRDSWHILCLSQPYPCNVVLHQRRGNLLN